MSLNLNDKKAVVAEVSAKVATAQTIVLADISGTNRRRILELTGGQGTMNVPNWAPDSSGFAYVRYAN